MAGNYSNVDRYKDNVSHDEPNIPSEWLASGYDVSNISTQIISLDNSVVEASSIHSAPVLNYSCLPIWGDQFIDVHSLRYNTNVESNASSSSSFSGIRAGVNWMPNAMIRDVMFMPATSGMLPQSLPPLPTDSTDPDFIESTARFSCFSGGTFNDILRPFSFPNSLDPSSIGYMPKQGDIFTDDGLNPSPVIEARSMIVGELKNVEETGVDESADHCEEAEFSRVDAQRNLAGTSVESSIRGVGMKKRKRTKQKPENQEDDKVSQPDAEKPSFTSDEIRQKGKLIDKFGKETKRNDPPEEGHIHVRARRGQATNSHSLAERIRREKISERMKYLQDLVPGCNKVMGKAVMLDEIINYVQSMQRQVELLSMKLATLNPQLEFNTEELVANDILQSGDGLSSSLAFPPGITMLLPSPSRQNQASLPGKRNSSMQVGLDLAPGVWDAALHNVVHNSLGSYSDPLSTQICRYPF